MRKRICPYCDQELEGRYCRGCRRFVKTPLIVDVNYYLNERHPASEENCQYHGDLPERTESLERRLPKRRYPGTRAPAPAEVRPGLAGDGPRCGSWPQPRQL